MPKPFGAAPEPGRKEMTPHNLSRRTFVLAATAATSLATLTIQPLGEALAATMAPTATPEAERAHHTLIGVL